MKRFTPAYLNIILRDLSQIGGQMVAIPYDELVSWLTEQNILGSDDTSYTVPVPDNIQTIIDFCNSSRVVTS